jgi:hypothetical protein
MGKRLWYFYNYGEYHIVNLLSFSAFCAVPTLVSTQSALQSFNWYFKKCIADKNLDLFTQWFTSLKEASSNLSLVG